MPHQATAKYTDLDDINLVEPDRTTQIQEALLEAAPGSVHARQLQQLLLEAYTETPAEEKLPRRQRVTIILGMTTGLWILIGLGAFLAF
jgi:myo-inositol catabolism protein IolC